MIELWKDRAAERCLSAEPRTEKSGPVLIRFVRAVGGGALVETPGFAQPPRIAYHSPDGYEWGYLGSGPADLALNLLYWYRDFPTAYRLHQRFKSHVISRIPQEGGGDLTRDQVEAWLAEWDLTEEGA